MDHRERFDEPEETLRSFLGDHQAGMWTSLPGTVESFNAAAMTVSVRPGVMGVVTQQDGTTTSKELPLLVDVPVHFPGGGGFTLTFPIQKGDECLLVFSSRPVDAWWQSGGVQVPTANRMHSLSDAFALVGFRSKPRALAVSGSATQLRSDDGGTAITMQPGSITWTAGGQTLALSSAGLTHNGVNVGSTHRHQETGSVTQPPL